MRDAGGCEGLLLAGIKRRRLRRLISAGALVISPPAPSSASATFRRYVPRPATLRPARVRRHPRRPLREPARKEQSAKFAVSSYPPSVSIKPNRLSSPVFNLRVAANDGVGTVGDTEAVELVSGDFHRGTRRTGAPVPVR
jgi:hypothetical protein